MPQPHDPEQPTLAERFLQGLDNGTVDISQIHQGRITINSVTSDVDEFTIRPSGVDVSRWQDHYQWPTVEVQAVDHLMTEQIFASVDYAAPDRTAFFTVGANDGRAHPLTQSEVQQMREQMERSFWERQFLMFDPGQQIRPREIPPHVWVADYIAAPGCYDGLHPNEVSIAASEQQANTVYNNLVREHRRLYEATHDLPERPETMPETISETAWNLLPSTDAQQISDHFRPSLNGGLSSWIMTHASTVLFVIENKDRNNFYRSLYSGLQNFASLTRPQYEAVQSDRERAINAPPPVAASPSFASLTDLAYIPNGKFSIEMDGEHITVQIYTPRRGPLEGQRIIKRQQGYGSFSGFATLTTEGEVHVWRRLQAELQDTKLLQFTNLLIQYFKLVYLSNTILPDHATVSNFPEQGMEFEIWTSQYCRVCNRELTNPQSCQDGIGPECSRRRTEEDRSVAARQTAQAEPIVFEDLDADRNLEPIRRRRAVVSSAAARRAAGDRSESVARNRESVVNRVQGEVAARQGRRTPLPLSQNGTGEVL